MKVAIAFLVGLVVAPGLAHAADRPSEWQCHLSPIAAGSKARIALVDPSRARVTDGAVMLSNGLRSPHLPHLIYFVRVLPDAVSWGARNARTASVYYRYDMQTATGLLTYHAAGVAASVGRCDQAI